MPADPNRLPDDERLRELILFIASRSRDDERFGSIKLNKLLFYSDFLAYVRLGSSITGHEYQKLPKGPAPRRMLPILKEMVSSRILAIEQRDYWGRPQKVPINLRPAKKGTFSGDEIVVVTEVIDALRSKNAKGISSLSHKFPGWKNAEDGETVPYQVALVKFIKPRNRDIQQAINMGDELTKLHRELSSDAG